MHIFDHHYYCYADFWPLELLLCRFFDHHWNYCCADLWPLFRVCQLSRVHGHHLGAHAAAIFHKKPEVSYFGQVPKCHDGDLLHVKSCKILWWWTSHALHTGTSPLWACWQTCCSLWVLASSSTTFCKTFPSPGRGRYLQPGASSHSTLAPPSTPLRGSVSYYLLRIRWRPQLTWR